MQVLQNKLSKVILSREVRNFYAEKKCYTIPTKELLKRSDQLSIHQMGALKTLILTKKIMQIQKPKYLADRLQSVQSRNRSGSIIPQQKSTLGVYREGFVERGRKLFNVIPDNLKCEEKIGKFKKLTKVWIKENIAISP